ncbi:MspA family porin, partial [Mycobacteroides abscessus subsp. massiliense]
LGVQSTGGVDDHHVGADLPMASMPLGAAGYGMADVTNMHIKADACGGPVTIRSFAYIRISTDVERSEFAIYGDPIQI